MVFEVADREQRLERIQQALAAAWDEYSYVDVDFMLRAHVEDFFKCLSAFCSPGHLAIENQEMSSRLCEVSRDIRFAVGSVGRIPEDLCSTVQDMFVLGSEVVEALGEPRLSDYAKNIRTRVDKLVRKGNSKGRRRSEAIH